MYKRQFSAIISRLLLPLEEINTQIPAESVGSVTTEPTINPINSQVNTVAVPESAGQVSAEPTSESAVKNEPKILIVEDERPLAHALELKLNHSGMQATAVNNGDDALVQLENSKFALILLDLILPGMDGFELLKEIRARDKAVKIVILSNLGQSEDRDRIEPYDVSAYYVKSNMPLAAVVESIQSLS